MKDFWKKVRALLISWGFVPTMAILAAVAVFTYLSYQSVTNDLIIERDREVTYLSAARMREELTKYTDILVALARTDDLTSDDPVKQQIGLINGRLRLSVFDGGVVMLNTLGKVVAAEPERPELVGADWSDREYFSQLLATRSQVFSDTLSDGPLAAKVVSMAVPVTGPNGEMRGALVGMFRLGVTTISPFYASIVRLRVVENGITYLVDGHGKVIYHTDISRTGENASNSPIVQAVMAGKAGATRVISGEGKDVVSSFAPVPGTPWGLVTEEDWGTLTASSRAYGELLLVLLGLGMILPALGVVQLARQRNREALERERMEHELEVAQIIQKTLLPKELPVLGGWEIGVHWQPARAVSGDFYDFLVFQDGNIGLVIADVTDKGVPAGLVMASTRSILRGVSERLRSPGEVLERVNSLLHNDIPQNMFVTCFYAELNPETGRMLYANAGQNLPYRKCSDGSVKNIEATGLPLGLMPDIHYDEYETDIEPDEMLFFYSDGLVEAHNPSNQMFSNRKLQQMLEDNTPAGTTGSELIQQALSALRQFTGESWNQEDDVTMITLRRLPVVNEREGEKERSAAGD